MCISNSRRSFGASFQISSLSLPTIDQLIGGENEATSWENKTENNSNDNNKRNACWPDSELETRHSKKVASCGDYKPKRRYVSLPGLTAKRNVRHFVKHSYQDMSNIPLRGDIDSSNMPSTFPYKLYAILEDDNDCVGWQPHGRSFLIHDPKTFVEHVLPKYFSAIKLTSFQRQLNLYGFERLTSGLDAGAYYNKYFLRGRLDLVALLKRTKVKGVGYKAAGNPDDEPDFYKMPLLTPPLKDEAVRTYESSPKKNMMSGQDWHRFAESIFEHEDDKDMLHGGMKVQSEDEFYNFCITLMNMLIY